MKLLLVLLAAVVGYSADVIDLTIKETAGVQRSGENVTMGVPLPEEGNYTDIARFVLKNSSGVTIPCEFKSLSMWYKNPTRHRWIQLNFQYSLNANATENVYLQYNTETYTPATSLTVTDQSTYYEVNTGKIRFHVKKANFNVIDQAWVDESGAAAYSDANKIIASHNRGLIFYDSLNTEFLSANDPVSAVTVERQGAGVITIKATGRLRSSVGSGSLYFVTRIMAFNQSSTVRIYHTVENRNALETSYFGFKGLHVELPLNLGATKNGVVGSMGGSKSATLGSGAELYAMCKRPDTSRTTMGQVIYGTIGGAFDTSFNPKSAKPRDLGWAALSDGSRGCLTSVKYFWQMVPTSVEVFGDGKIIQGLFSTRSNQRHIRFYSGAARTYETQLTFFNSKTASELRSKGVETTDRLYAVAPSYYYSRKAIAAYPMVEENAQSCYSSTNWTTIQAWQSRLSSIWTTVLNADNIFLGYDSYGFLEWGDNPHYIASYTFPWKVLWNGNYYGLPFFSFDHFFHTRDMRFLEYAISHSRHVQDVHLVHYGPNSGATGGSRYSPPAYHFSTDADPTVSSGTFTIDNPSHHQVEALFLDYYLTGNDFALDMGIHGAKWFAKAGTYYANPGQEIQTYIRRWAHQMFAQAMAYQHNQDTTYYNCMYRNWMSMKENIRLSRPIGQAFMNGFGMEAIVKLHHFLSPTFRTTSGIEIPDSIPHFLKIWADSCAKIPYGTTSSNINGNSTLGYAFLSKYYGSTYQTLAAQRAATLTTPSNLHKDFAQQARNWHMAMYYMAIPESLSSYTASEKGSFIPEKRQGIALSAAPSPFNPVTEITVSGGTIWNKTPLSIAVYAPDGTLVRTWKEIAHGRSHTVSWNASNRSSGIYIVKCMAGGQEASVRVTLVK